MRSSLSISSLVRKPGATRGMHPRRNRASADQTAAAGALRGDLASKSGHRMLRGLASSALGAVVGLAVFGPRVADGQPRSPEVEAFWNAYRAARAVWRSRTTTSAAWATTRRWATSCWQLILDGPKRATACLLRDVETGGEMMARRRPRRGARRRRPAARDLAHAHRRREAARPGRRRLCLDEGEGDRTRADWLAMHVRYFARRGRRKDSPSTSMPAVFERFIWSGRRSMPTPAKQK